MLKLTFTLKQISDDVISLRLFWGFRVVFVVLFGLIAGSIYVPRDTGGGSVSALAIVLLVLFAFIALYDERWTFKRSDRTIIHAHGVLVLHKTSIYQVSDQSSFEVSGFRKGSVGGEEKRKAFQRDLVRLRLVVDETETRDIEITEKKNTADLQGKAAALSDFMHVDYHADI